MTETTIVTIIVAAIAALPPTLVAYAGLRKGRETGLKADVIHELADGNLLRITEDLAAANHEIAGLREQVTALVQQRKDGEPHGERRKAKGRIA
jgi:hypothetical protein